MLLRRGTFRPRGPPERCDRSGQVAPARQRYRVDVIDPLQSVRIVMEETEGLPSTSPGTASSLSFKSSRISCAGHRVTLNAQRFAQLGSWSGHLVIDGEDHVDPRPGSAAATAHGASARRRGRAAGRPSDPPFEGMWWLYVPIAFDDFAIVLIIQEEPSGFRSLNDCTRIWRDGRVEQLGWPRAKIHYRSGTRIPTGATIEATDSPAPRSASTWNPNCRPDSRRRRLRRRPDWLHEPGRVPASPNVAPTTWRIPAISRDPRSASSITWDMRSADNSGSTEGWGLFEHGALGRHDPSGFADWLTVAP